MLVDVITQYEVVLKAISAGIHPKKASGYYVAYPAREIFELLPSLNPKQLDSLAIATAEAFPQLRPGKCVHLTCFIRYVYGCFDKQGLLNSKTSANIKQKQPDWSLSDYFMDRVAFYMDKKKRSYGLVLYYEMKAHRIGDKVILDNNKELIDTMLSFYEKAVQLAVILRAWKNTYSPYFWAANYLMAFGEVNRAKEYCLKFLENVNFYGDSPFLRGKLTGALNMLKRNMTDKEWRKLMRRCRKRFKNKVFKQVRFTKFVGDVSEITLGA